MQQFSDHDGALPLDPMLSDRQRLWGALETLWRYGSSEEAARLARRFVGANAVLHNGETYKLLRIKEAYVDPNPISPRGFDIHFDWECEGMTGGLTDFHELDIAL